MATLVTAPIESERQPYRLPDEDASTAHRFLTLVGLGMAIQASEGEDLLAIEDELLLAIRAGRN